MLRKTSRVRPIYNIARKTPERFYGIGLVKNFFPFT